MKKRKLIGLGVCALALGAVAGAVSAQHALQTKAGESDITVYFKDAGWWAADGARTGTHLWKNGGEASTEWPGNVMEKVATVGGHGVWKATIDTSVYDRLIFTRYGATTSADWGAKSVEINLGEFDAAKPLYDISGVATPQWGDPGVTGTWAAYDEPTPEPDPDPDPQSWGICGTMTSWGDAADIPLTYSEETGWHTITVDLELNQQFKFREGGKWDLQIGNLMVQKLSNTSLLTFASGNIVVKASGSYTFGIKDGLTPDQTESYAENLGNVSAVFNGETPEPQSDVRTFKFSNTGNWANVNYYTWEGETPKAPWPGEALTAGGDGLYSVDIDVSTYTSVIFNDGGSNQTPDISLVGVASGTIFQADGSVWVPEGEKTYSVSVAGTPLEMELNEYAELKEGQTGEYFANAKLNKDDALVFSVNGTAITTGIGPDEGDAGNAVFEYDPLSITVHNSTTTEVGIYLKTWNNGGYSVWVGGYELGISGFFMLTASGSWTPEGGIASNGPSGLNVATFINVDLAKDEEFTIANFYDGHRDAYAGWEYDAGWSELKGGDAADNFEDANDFNHIKVSVAGKYCIYVNESHEIYINPYQVTPEDRAAVEGFIASYITEQAKDPKPGDTCQAKYEAAKEALKGLTEVQQDLFRTDDAYADSYAIYLYWELRVTGNNANNVAALSTSGTAAIVATSIVVVGAVLAGAMIYLSRKRRAE